MTTTTTKKPPRRLDDELRVIDNMLALVGSMNFQTRRRALAYVCARAETLPEGNVGAIEIPAEQTDIFAGPPMMPPLHSSSSREPDPC